MNQAKNGHRVKIHYTTKSESGDVLDTSKGDRPVQIRIGRNLIPVLENAVKGMETGQVKTISVPPEKGHGEWLKELLVDVKRSKLPKDLTPIVGHELLVRKPDGSHVNAVIVDIKEDDLTVDMNRPLAGKPMLIDIELVEII
jgi:FKBP-type peptidyl-prolyl cis-trans isomerase 2